MFSVLMHFTVDKCHARNIRREITPVTLQIKISLAEILEVLMLLMFRTGPQVQSLPRGLATPAGNGFVFNIFHPHALGREHFVHVLQHTKLPHFFVCSETWH